MLIKPNASGGNLNAYRQGFWDQRKGTKDPVAAKYRPGSPLANWYRLGYIAAEQSPGECGAWCFNRKRLVELALKMAIEKTKNLDGQVKDKSKLQEVHAIRVGWIELLETKVWERLDRR